jgi:hypothetical protein
MADSPKPDTADAEQTPVQKWTLEMQAAERFFEEFHRKSKKVVKRYIDEREDGDTGMPQARLNLFHANITTMRAMMYAKLPKVEADRRFADPNDDVARVAGEMITRILQNDMNQEDNALKPVLQHAIDDRLIAGLGCARVKYCCEDDKDKIVAQVEDEATPLYAKKDEWCDEVYMHWRDVRWSPARTYEELRWMAYRSYLTKDEAVARFGQEVTDGMSFDSRGPQSILESGSKPAADVARQAEVWEIWDKDTKTVAWFAKGAADLLDTKPDTLQLKEFFPSARPMIANATTDKYIPKADFLLAQDIYNKIDVLETRIGLLTEACKAVGVYAGDQEAVKNMLQEGAENQLIPVDNWAMWAERGGVKGAIEWFPIGEIAEVLALLANQQSVQIQKLYQVTGMSDIMRGQASAAGTTATEQKIKAQFGSVRISALQDEFAEFAQDLMNKKVQLIRRFYDADRIIKLSNAMQTPDAKPSEDGSPSLVEQAVQLIKSPDDFDLRISIKAESMAAVDLDALKQERTDFIQGMAQFVGQSTQLATSMPEIMPFLMQIMRFGLSGYKAASEMEGVVDQAIAAVEKSLAEKQAKPPEPSPEEKKLQMEGQQKQAEFQMKQQESQQSAQLEQQKMQFELSIKQQEFELDKQKMLMEIEFKKQELAMKQQEFEMKLRADQASAEMDMQTQAAKASQDIALGAQKADIEVGRAESEEERAQAGFEADQARQDTAAKAAAKREPNDAP